MTDNSQMNPTQLSNLVNNLVSGDADRTAYEDPDYHLPEDYHRDLSNFLKKLDYLENGLPDFAVSRYEENDDLQDRLYKTDDIQEEGDRHIEEYMTHLTRSELPHCQLVASTESCVWQEPFYGGAPVHTSYTAVKVPYNLLPIDIIPDDWSQVTKTGVFVGQDRLVSMIIGKSGCHLKQLTQECGIHYLWYDPNPMGMSHPTRDDGVFQIWGRSGLVPYAKARLQTHIQNIINQIWYQVESHPVPDVRVPLDPSPPYQDGLDDMPHCWDQMKVDQYLQNSYNNETLKDIIFQERLSKPYKRHDKTPYEPSRSEMIEFISQQLTWTPSYRDSFSII